MEYPKIDPLIERNFTPKTVIRDYELEHEFNTIGPRIMNLNAFQLRILKKISVLITREEKKKKKKEEEEELILLAIEDITERRKAEQSFEEAYEYAKGIVETVREPLIVLDAKLKVISANKSFYHTFKVNLKETKGHFIYDLGNQQWNIPKLRRLLKDILIKDNSFDNYEIEHNFEKIGLKTMLLNARRIPRLPAKPRIILLAIEDITSLRNVEKERYESVLRYQTLFLSSRDAVMTLEPPSWKFTSGNPATLKMFKAKNEAEFLSYGPWKLSPRLQPDGRVSSEKAKEMIEIAMRKGTNYFEWVHKRINGEEFFASVLLSRIKSKGKFFLHALVRDITERKKVVEALRASEERFRSIFDEAGYGILLVRVGSRKFYMGNKAICQMLGYSMEEIKHLSVKDIHPKKDLPYIMGIFKKQTKGDISLARDLPVKRKNGSVFYADINAKIIKIVGKSYLMGFFHDVTERRELEQALENIREAKEKAILSAIGDGVVACDTTGKIILFNQIASELTGFSSNEAIGKHYNQILSFVKEDTNKPGKDFIAQAIKEGKMMSMVNHMMIIKKNGMRISVADSAAPIFGMSGKVTGCVMVFRDVTRERELDRTKTEFVSIASHQLRTPLTGIQWLTELLKKEKLTNKGQEYLGDIKTSIERLNKLVELLLNTSRIQAGKVSISPQSIDVVNFIKKIVNNLSALYIKKRLSITFASDKKRIIAMTDVGALQNIGQVIIANAIEYTPEGGKIEVRLNKHGQMFLITVSDTGIGIPKKDQGRMFQEFARAGNAGRIKAAGMGLGLWIAKQAVELLGGKIWFKSEENKGTIFFVELPIKTKSIKGTKQLL